jgi:hypothetical protein
MTTVFCSQCGNDFTATPAHPWGYSHCANHRVSTPMTTNTPVDIDTVIGIAKHNGKTEALLAACRVLRKAGKQDAAELLLERIDEVTA